MSMNVDLTLSVGYRRNSLCGIWENAKTLFVHHDPEASDYNNLFEVVIIIPCFPDVPISQRR